MPSAKDGRMSACGSCDKERKALYRASNPAAIKKASLKHYYKNKEVCLQKAREWKKANRDKCRMHNQNSPEPKERTRKRARQWAIDNRERYRLNMASASAKRRILKKNQTPAEITEAEKTQIKAVYRIAAWLREHGDNVHVDHIIPLSKGGSHRYHNLQILSASDNHQKRDKAPTDKELEIINVLQES